MFIHIVSHEVRSDNGVTYVKTEPRIRFVAPELFSFRGKTAIGEGLLETTCVSNWLKHAYLAHRLVISHHRER